MSTDLDMFVDTFQDLDFEDLKLKKTTAKKTETKSLAKETIKKIAEESDFHSRQKETPKKEKSKTYNKTFSLFQDECQVINNIIRAYYDAFEDDLSRPSGSDVVRAALHELSKKSLEKQLSIVKNHRGRGRK